jgi:hypothetical protein
MNKSAKTTRAYNSSAVKHCTRYGVKIWQSNVETEWVHSTFVLENQGSVTVYTDLRFPLFPSLAPGRCRNEDSD